MIDLSQLPPEIVSWIPFGLFVVITVGLWSALSLLNRRDNRAVSRLDLLKNPLLREKHRQKKQGMSELIEKAAPALSKALEPKTELEQNELKIRLSNAGFHSPLAPQLYLAIRFCGLLLGAFLGGGVGLLTYGLNKHGYTTLALSAGLGFYMPELILRWLKARRQEQIFLSLPDVLDLLVVCVEAGLGLDAAMRRVVDEMGDTHPVITSELNLSLLQLNMGRPRRDVLHDLGVRTGVDDVKALVAILIQADKFGSSIAQALRVQSDAMRVKRRQIAEEKAQKTAVQMLFPLVLFIFPGIFVVLVGPAAIRMIDQLLTE
ncbi:MAG: secretion protein [Planctomycetaceae bacterium]|nr:MAG: secretion protein [Planctomycetaceae bacterium]